MRDDPQQAPSNGMDMSSWAMMPSFGSPHTGNSWDAQVSARGGPVTSAQFMDMWRQMGLPGFGGNALTDGNEGGGQNGSPVAPIPTFGNSSAVSGASNSLMQNQPRGFADLLSMIHGSGLMDAGAYF